MGEEEVGFEGTETIGRRRRVDGRLLIGSNTMYSARNNHSPWCTSPALVYGILPRAQTTTHNSLILFP
jgi:hypothetical protein